jgi:mycothiol synthase
LKTERVNNLNITEFIEYCKKHAAEHDESNIPSAEYKPRTDEPAFLLRTDIGELIGAASLMLHKEYVDSGKARFRIFHSIEKSFESYKLLLNEIERESQGVKYIYCYITEGKSETHQIWENLGFSVWRYSWVLERSTAGFTPHVFPEGFEIRTMRDGIDEEAWADIINEAFANMLGHTHLTPQKIAGWKKEECYIPAGMKMLWDASADKPIGTIAMIKEKEKGEEIIFIEAISLLNSYQGRGLGKNLLRYGIKFAQKFGVNKALLSVNAENSGAADLYFKEGFTKIEVYLCYHKKINNS